MIPFAYTLMMIFSVNNRKLIRNLGIITINIVMFLRFTIYPVILCTSLAKQNVFIEFDDYSNTSIKLMIYEMLIVFIIINYWGKKRLNEKYYNNEKLILLKTKVNFPILVAIGLFLVAIVMNPVQLYKYFNFNQIALEASNLPGFLQVFFNIGIDILFILILYMLYKSTLPSFFKITISLGISLFIIYGETNIAFGKVSRWGFLLYSIVILSILTNFYKMYSKILLATGLPIMVFSLIYLTFTKFGNDFSFLLFFNEYLSAKSLDYYFMGIENLNYGLATATIYSESIDLSTMFTDMFSAVPILSELYNPYINSTPIFFHKTMGRTDTIVPTLTQSYSYFGFIGAPFYSVIFTILAIEANRKLKKSSNLFMFFVLSQLTIWFGLFMAINANIIFEGTWWRIIFIVIIYLNSKLVINKKGVKNAYS